jgi:hypothetical protein
LSELIWGIIEAARSGHNHADPAVDKATLHYYTEATPTSFVKFRSDFSDRTSIDGHGDELAALNPTNERQELSALC